MVETRRICGLFLTSNLDSRSWGHLGHYQNDEGGMAFRQIRNSQGRWTRCSTAGETWARRPGRQECNWEGQYPWEEGVTWYPHPAHSKSSKVELEVPAKKVTSLLSPSVCERHTYITVHRGGKHGLLLSCELLTHAWNKKLWMVGPPWLQSWIHIRTPPIDLPKHGSRCLVLRAREALDHSWSRQELLANVKMRRQFEPFIRWNSIHLELLTGVPMWQLLRETNKRTAMKPEAFVSLTSDFWIEEIVMRWASKLFEQSCVCFSGEHVGHEIWLYCGFGVRFFVHVHITLENLYSSSNLTACQVMKSVKRYINPINRLSLCWNINGVVSGHIMFWHHVIHKLSGMRILKENHCFWNIVKFPIVNCNYLEAFISTGRQKEKRGKGAVVSLCQGDMLCMCILYTLPVTTFSEIGGTLRSHERAECALDERSTDMQTKLWQK